MPFFPGKANFPGKLLEVKLKNKSLLPILIFYAQHFDTVEVNFSFYRLPERSVFETWRNQTPDSFLFFVLLNS
ncbi:DUF72 domain-containing protein [[Phormidium ambiguum] IAM M-71]|uniref:DUF72 domain-containing protein n=1 Tax=[Phormidium ambiguum] IAM M-71 TaxID=454136 RepID=UPI0038B379FE